MTVPSPRQQKILAQLLRSDFLQSSEIHQGLVGSGEDVSLPTIKRELSEMTQQDFIVSEGGGRSIRYRAGVRGRLFSDVEARAYCSIEPDERYGLAAYNFELLRSFPTDIFTDPEAAHLEEATEHYKKNAEQLSDVTEKKELERFIIELSWKSSKIEGNTYTLLDTEKLILEHTEAQGHSKEEARMILNHKDAFEYIHRNRDEFRTITRKNLEDVHALLIKDLGVKSGLRSGLVGVTGSRYRPLDNIHQIEEVVDDLCARVASTPNPYAKALIALIGIAYIQPFEDGNKRTSRLMGNALLLAHGLSPLSYRSVDERDYREAMLVFYELNSILPIKRIFIEQYLFATDHYAVV